MPPLVAEQTGTYVGVARQGLTYKDISQAVESRLVQTGALYGMIGWYRDPRYVMTPLTRAPDSSEPSAAQRRWRPP